MYVVINVEEPDGRLFWSNEDGWVSDVEDADTFTEEETHTLRPPFGGGFIKKEVFL